jgi:hypothetical protein
LYFCLSEAGVCVLYCMMSFSFSMAVRRLREVATENKVKQAGRLRLCQFQFAGLLYTVLRFLDEMLQMLSESVS